MSQDKVILATTEVIDGVMLTRESLVYAAATINGQRLILRSCTPALNFFPKEMERT